MEKPIGLYLHIPFCLAKCRYCDFCSFPARRADKGAYVNALCKEIAVWGEKTGKREVDTLFFGGGTPSLLSPAEWGQIASALKAAFTVLPSAEWTSEANPATLTEEGLFAMRACGVNRISIGMQSSDDGELALLGRIHRFADVEKTVSLVKSAGFTDFNLDLMYGIPRQTPTSFSQSLDRALSLSPTHLSVYSLQIEEGTPFFAERASLPLPSEEEEAAMAEILQKKTEAAGLYRYEISNYAKAGFECRHNLKYWSLDDYLGFGVSAHSLLGGNRFFNRSDLDGYLAAPTAVCEEEETLTDEEAEKEYVMLRLRLVRGIDEEMFFLRFGHPFYETYEEKLLPFFKLGLVCRENGRVFLSGRGLAVSNTVLAALI